MQDLHDNATVSADRTQLSNNDDAHQALDQPVQLDPSLLLQVGGGLTSSSDLPKGGW